MDIHKRDFLEQINYDLFGGKIEKISFLRRIILKYVTPSTSFVYFSRKMWYHYQVGWGISKLKSKLLYLYIYRRYNCCVFQDAIVGKGLKVHHPLGIVIGHCIIGENCTILQNVTIGEKRIGENTDSIDNRPRIGDNVTICAGACILGKINIIRDTVIAANSVVIKDITTSGVWGGIPAKLLK